MFALLTNDLLHWEFYLRNPWMLLLLAFQIWMLVDALRRQEWIWAVLIFLFSFLTAIFYYFLVYRNQAVERRPLQLPGSQARKRIKELEAQIHHLDKAHHWAELGSIHLEAGRLKEAEECFRKALEREPDDADFQALLGTALLHEKRFEEAVGLLQKVASTNPKHDYGQTMMSLAEGLTALGQTEAAAQIWQKVLEQYTYARARVQLAELYLAKGEVELARKELQDVLSEDAHAASFQRKQEKIWTKRAKALLSKIS